jgi:hypothetical protein
VAAAAAAAAVEIEVVTPKKKIHDLNAAAKRHFRFWWYPCIPLENADTQTTQARLFRSDGSDEKRV